MKKIKFVMIAVAIATALGSAFATTRCFTCEYYPQYRYVNGGYSPAGDAGIDYICLSGGGVCTYYKPSLSSEYIPCQAGTYYPLH